LLALPGKHDINGEAFNFGPPADQNFTVIELLQELAKSWDANNTDIVQVEPSDFHEAGLLKLNIDKALFYQNWKPTLNFLETSRFTSDWYKSFYQENNADMLRFTNNQILEYIELAKSKNIAWSLK
jgi:CDP-glucose 4,6-dehydratase